MKKILYSSLVATALMLTACSQASSTANGISRPTQTLALTGEDFEIAAEAMINSLFSDANFAHIKASQPKVVAMGRIINDTALRIDTQKLTAKITQAMRHSGKFVLSSAVAAGGALDSMSEQVRELRANDEFNQNTIAKKGTLIAPDYSLAGTIRQDNIRLNNGKTKVEYFFLLRLSDLNSGLVIWEQEQSIDKLGSSKSVTW